MLLTFNERFIPGILNGNKRTTFRIDSNRRWKVGMKIHFWSGNPRNVSRNPYPLAIGTVDSIDEVSIRDGILTINNNPVENIDEVAMIDGFRNFEEMYEFLGDFAGIRIVWNYDQLIRFESKKIY